MSQQCPWEEWLNAIVYAIPVFVALMAAEFGIGLALGRNVYRLNDAVGSLTAGILSQISGVFTLALPVGVYVVVYDRLDLLPLGADDLRGWGLSLLAPRLLSFCSPPPPALRGAFWGVPG